MVDALLDVEPFEGAVLDPASGSGNIVDACFDRGIQAIGSDIHDYGHPFSAGGVDFHSYSDDARVDNIICNPPFKGVEAWMTRAIRMATKKCALLGPLTWLEGKKRGGIFKATPLYKVWVFSSRQSMPPGESDVPAEGGKKAFAWFVWDHSYWGQGDPTIGWLP